MEFLYEQISNLKKNYFLFLLIILLVVLNDVVIISGFSFLNHNKAKVVSSVNSNKNNVSTLEEKNTYCVDIKGSVKKEGVYCTDKQILVNDVIKMAGGLKKKASTSNINLSKKIIDEMVIVIPSKTDLKKQEKNVLVKNDALVINNDNNDNYVDTLSANIGESKKVNINYASLDELLSITGIGKSKAEAIISYREKNKFKSIDDVKNVSGIGEALFEKIKNFISV